MIRFRAFTLIELLISVAICSLIVASAFAAFMQVRTVSLRSKAITALHREAAAIHTLFDGALSACFHGAQIRLAIVNPGTPQAQVTLDLMQAVTARDALGSYQPGPVNYSDANYLLDVQYKNFATGLTDPRVGDLAFPAPVQSELRWRRFTFSATDAELLRPTLHAAMTPDSWTIPMTAGATDLRVIDPGLTCWLEDAPGVPSWLPDQKNGIDDIAIDEINGIVRRPAMPVRVGPEVRRDRRRTMDDNDLRLWSGIPKTTWQAWMQRGGTRLTTPPPSDVEQLRSAAQRQLISDNISQFRLEWVDAQGMRTSCDPALATGIAYTYDQGTAVTPPATMVTQTPAYTGINPWSSTLRVVDGMWADGSSTPCPLFAATAYPHTGRQPSPADERPILLRLGFTLTDRRSALVDPEHPISRSFSFTFALSPLTVAPPRSP